MKKKQARALIGEWIYTLGLRRWDIEIFWHRSKKSVKHYFKHRNIAADVHAEWWYERARIHINQKLLLSQPDDEIPRIIVHELMHIFLNEARQKGILHEERVATMLTRAIFWVDGREKK